MSVLNPPPIPHLIPFVHGTVRPGTGNTNRPQNFHSEKDKDNQNKQSMGGKREERCETAIACNDGRASAMPTVLWLANLEVPDPEWRKGRKKNQAALQCGNQPLFEPWEKSHVVVIFILK